MLNATLVFKKRIRLELLYTNILNFTLIDHEVN